MTSGRRRAELVVDEERDDRLDARTTGDERPMLVGFLRAQRTTLMLKCAGLETELARRSVPPSTLSLLGLVRHLADVERRWFRHVLSGQAVPPLFGSATHPDAANITVEARRNRTILGAALEEAGLVNYPTEWWHWSYGDRYWALATGASHALYAAAE
ncbi:mycothiol transferase [Streptomyces longisporoflavus]|uniref:DUF664 domain-containing protein n=1 Tax=Streptomyces longisporoflavus TaxID=28044 RepID=A0ABW7QQL7_9ACTN